MRIRTGSETAVMVTINIGDNTWDVVMPVIIDGLYPEVAMAFDIVIGGGAFDDGTLYRILLVPMDLSLQGECLLHFLKTRLSGSNCYKTSIWHGLTKILYYSKL